MQLLAATATPKEHPLSAGTDLRVIGVAVALLSSVNELKDQSWHNLELLRKLQAIIVKTHQGAAEMMRPIARK